MSNTPKLREAIDKKHNVSLVNNNYYVIIRNKIYEEFGEKEELKSIFFHGKLQIKEEKIKFLNPANIDWKNMPLLDLTEKMEEKRYENDVIEYKMTDLKIKKNNGFDTIDEAKMKELFNGDIILNNELCFFNYNKLTDYDFYIIEENKSPKKTLENLEPLIEEDNLDQKRFEDNARFLESIKAKKNAVENNIQKTMAETNKLEKIVNANIKLRELTKNRIESLQEEKRNADIKAHAALLKQQQINQNIKNLNTKKKTIQGLVAIIGSKREEKNNTFMKRLDNANSNKLPNIKTRKNIDNNMVNQLFSEDKYKIGGKRQRKTRKQKKN